MKKYIRTKEDIFETKYFENEQFIKNKDGYTWCAYYIFITKNEIIKEADNIEELCDEFVGIDDWNRHHRIENPNNIEIVKNFLKTFKEKYGAIWTNKGLIFVAKLNENDEWELI